MKTLLTTKEAASILGYSQGHVCRLVTEGGIPFVKIGRRYFIPEDELARWMSDGEGKNDKNGTV